jgi:hypothetical protein
MQHYSQELNNTSFTAEQSIRSKGTSNMPVHGSTTEAGRTITQSTSQSESQAPTKTSLTDLNSHFVETLKQASIDWDGNCEFDESGKVVGFKIDSPSNNRYMRPIPRSDKSITEAMKTKSILQDAMKSPSKSEMSVELKKLSLHCGLQNKAPEEVALMAEDYFEDLGQYPLFLLQEACKKYRTLPEGNNFMPSSGKLISLMADKYHKLKFLQSRVDKILGLHLEAEKPRENKGISLNEALNRLLG